MLSVFVSVPVPVCGSVYCGVCGLCVRVRALCCDFCMLCVLLCAHSIPACKHIGVFYLMNRRGRPGLAQVMVEYAHPFHCFLLPCVHVRMHVHDHMSASARNGTVMCMRARMHTYVIALLYR